MLRPILLLLHRAVASGMLAVAAARSVWLAVGPALPDRGWKRENGTLSSGEASQHLAANVSLDGPITISVAVAPPPAAAATGTASVRPSIGAWVWGGSVERSVGGLPQPRTR